MNTAVSSTLAIFEERVGYAPYQSPLKEVIEMRTLPTTMIRVLAPFAPLFSGRVWGHVQVLLARAILAPGKRTVSSALRATGLDQEQRFYRYHRVLSRAVWSPKEASRVLFGLLVETRSSRRGRSSWASTRRARETQRTEDSGQGHLP